MSKAEAEARLRVLCHEIMDKISEIESGGFMVGDIRIIRATDEDPPGLIVAVYAKLEKAGEQAGTVKAQVKRGSG